VRGAIAFTVIIAATRFLAAPSAEAGTVTCTYDANTKTVTAAPAGSNQVSIRREGDEIVASGLDCGAATRFNTDTIVVNDVPDHNLTGFVSLSSGPLRPGSTNEPGSSDEIELEFNLGNGTNGFDVHGTEQGDRLRAGTTFTSTFVFHHEVNLNPGEATGIDDDVDLNGSLDHLTLEGFGAADELSLAGGAGTGSPLLEDAFLYGGTGVDELTGGIGDDQVEGAEQGDTLRGGAGDDDLLGAQGGDILRGNADDDSLDGAGGDDYLNGGPDTDTCDAGTGTNTVTNCE
jgi:Ca2+-binding RTX toxin-like protein